jgi:hypothetical protein
MQMKMGEKGKEIRNVGFLSVLDSSYHPTTLELKT